MNLKRVQAAIWPSVPTNEVGVKGLRRVQRMLELWCCPCRVSSEGQNGSMERPIDFSRDRDMLCASCGHRFRVSLGWIDSWEQGKEVCPGCSLTCEHEDAPKVAVDPDDVALDRDLVSSLFWYHSSTHQDWPRVDFDPAADLDSATRERQRKMLSERRLSSWAARQRAKALHVGSYEAAIHNMLRRVADQGDRHNQFHLFRVRLKPSVIVREDWLIDPTNFVGDVELDDVRPPGIDVARYLNRHEDPGSLSLALGRDSIESVQQITVPLPEEGTDSWIKEVTQELKSASPVVPDSTKPGIWAKLERRVSPRAELGHKIGASLAAHLPINLRYGFGRAAAFEEGDDPAQWARRTLGLAHLVLDPQRALAALNEALIRRLQ